MELGDARTLAIALRDLLDQAQTTLRAAAGSSPLLSRIRGHLDRDVKDVVCVTERFPSWEHANLQLGVEDYLRSYGGAGDWFGVSGHGREHDELVNMLMSLERGFEQYEAGAVDYATVAVGPDETMEAVHLGLVLTSSPGGAPIILGLRGMPEHGLPECRIDVLAASRADATAARDEVTRRMREHDVFRGKILTFGSSEHRGNELLSFMPRPELRADEIVLPPGVLDTIERHVIEVGAMADRLRAHGQHLKRGLLLHGPPGTGKTHTVRYLMGRTPGSTVIVITGPAMQWISQAAALARRLQPAIVVIEDVDLIAMDREYTPGGNPLLFSLLDAMDGVGADCDVTFVLTTNRADALERALSYRPGRVDLAVEVPKPDAEGREALIRLYGRGLRLPPDLAEVVARTEGMTASFFKELLRRTVLTALRERESVDALTGAHLTTALDEMLGEREALTRSLLGGGEYGDAGPDPFDDFAEAPPFAPGPDLDLRARYE
ncbi:AAA family ATPase [Bailinhaonella thermotolerans]|uniref:ATP-binding protein n=1 Tax=Bailinhaonella thermotolerans TaxID=1070861 RepID=A0A3A4AQ77_9ACTN|nr:ATP-binding protein [Bailinhaonella thermotolerans]RJL31856.1 ATP-binding protein [Bailinhaonella thermotolerans]